MEKQRRRCLQRSAMRTEESRKGISKISGELRQCYEQLGKYISCIWGKKGNLFDFSLYCIKH